MIPASSQLDVALRITEIEYVSVEARQAQTKRSVPLMGAILQRSTFFLLLVGRRYASWKVITNYGGERATDWNAIRARNFSLRWMLNKQCGVRFLLVCNFVERSADAYAFAF